MIIGIPDGYASSAERFIHRSLFLFRVLLGRTGISLSTGRNDPTIAVFIHILVAVMCLVLLGCGRKEMPSAPRQVPPQSVTDLSAQISGNEVVLRWSFSIALYGSEPIERFAVFRASEPVSESCDNCPLMFKRLIDIPILEGEGETSFLTYRDRLEKGYRYRYKVIGYSTAGLAGRDSNIVMVEGE
jgi:hypothetical protein